MTKMELTQKEWEEKLVSIRPSDRQMKWQETEFYGFIHFNINTFTGKQWGDGTESPFLFNPTELDVNQWVETLKRAGMKGVILTCKHHDGFCLWPSAYTDHTVASSPWKKGEGDLVREVSEACQRHNLKFGVYLSPWDRHEASYGDSPRYNDFFVKQLEELLTQYGDIFSVWFDGACGEGPNGQKQVYDWDRYYEVIRTLQPDAAISVCGPDVRWCGNEAGATREQEWSVVPKILQNAEKIQNESQQDENHQAFIKQASSAEEDLGSREVLEMDEELVWYPSEVNTSIRPSWFYEEKEDKQVKSVENLFDLYLRIVGGNATFLLNVPPDRRGLIHEKDVSVLEALGEKLKHSFDTDLSEKAKINTVDKKTIHLTFDEETTLNCLEIQEDIKKGQRVEAFCIQAVDLSGARKTLYEGTVIGYKKIARFESVTTKQVEISIKKSRMDPIIKKTRVFNVKN